MSAETILLLLTSALALMTSWRVRSLERKSKTEINISVQPGADNAAVAEVVRQAMIQNARRNPKGTGL